MRKISLSFYVKNVLKVWRIGIKQNIRENKKVKQTIATMIKENFSDSREEHSYKVLQFSAF